MFGATRTAAERVDRMVCLAAPVKQAGKSGAAMAALVRHREGVHGRIHLADEPIGPGGLGDAATRLRDDSRLRLL